MAAKRFSSLSSRFGRFATLVLVAALALPIPMAAPAMANGLDLLKLQQRNRAQQFARQTELMDSRLASQYQQSRKLRPTGRDVVNITTIELSPQVPAYKGKSSSYMPLAKAAAARHGIPESLFLRLVQQESGWNPKARSHAGAIGLAQLMPGTARLLGVNPHDPAQNLEGGARYLRQQYNTFGDWRLALAAYNAGPGAVKKYGGIPPYRETRNYVKIIAGR